MKLVDTDEVYKVLVDYYHLRTEIQHKALKEALGRVSIIDVDSLNTAHEDIGYEKGYRDGYAEALEVADNTEPIKHGHWNERYDTRYHFECSICKYLHQYKDNYCPLCGAKMDEEVNENETC